MSQSTNSNAISTAFVSFDGLAGDVRVVKARIAQRDQDIAILDQQIITLDQGFQREERSIYIPSLAADRVLEKEMQALQRKRDKLKLETERRLTKLTTQYQHVRHPLYLQLSGLQAESDYDRQSIAPIRKLPTEILCEIFRIFVAFEGSPLILTGVNKGWQEKAMAMQDLWTHISFRCTPTVRGGHRKWRTIRGTPVYSQGRKLICHDINGFSLVLGLTGVLHLHLDFVLQRHNDGTPSLLLALTDVSISSRIVSLKIDDDGFTTPKDLQVGSLSNLQRFKLKCNRATLGNAIMESMKQSHAIPTHVDLCVAAKFPIILPSVRRFWQNLQVLDLGGCSTPAQLNEVARHMKSIEKLRGCPPQWPDAVTQPVRFPCLISLQVTCNPQYLRRLERPLMQSI